MSSHLQVYVGPYLEITEPITLRIVDLCEGHGRRDNDKYCPQCRREKRGYVSRDGPLNEGFFDHDDWVDKLVRTFITGRTSFDVWTVVPNRRAADGKSFGIQLSREDGNGAHDLPTLGTFEAEHADEIARIRELGCVAVAKLGVVSWYS